MATTRLMTAEDLANLDDKPGRYDLIRGELVHMPPAGGEHGEVGMLLAIRVGGYVLQHQLGKAYAAETGFTLSRNPDTVLAPDLAFVSTERLPSREERIGFVPVAPDLIVEIISPSERAGMIARKVSEYLSAGVQAIWLVHPGRKSITIHTQDEDVVVLTMDDELDGGDVLPGFRLPVADIFES